ncbi:MAG: bifunctional hydroxymethylpyrimidine kinase/phosphomethylpyrimidine kinase [Terriglobales bacterium]
MPPIVLSIAGFDPSSGAGVTADLKTIAAHGCYGVGCVTALTVQSTQGVSRVEPVSAVLVTQTLESLAADLDITAIRIGMLGSADVAGTVAGFLSTKDWKNGVLDPVLRSSSGTELLDSAGQDVLIKQLLPWARVVTPNLAEASVLTGRPLARNAADMAAAAEALQKLGAKDVLITGGHLPGNVDVLLTAGGEVHQIAGARVESKATHGTGCALATAITCNLALGMDVLSAARAAKEYVRQAIEAAYPIGKGSGPMNHLFKIKP